MIHGGDLIKVARTTRGMTQDELSNSERFWPAYITAVGVQKG